MPRPLYTKGKSTQYSLYTRGKSTEYLLNRRLGVPWSQYGCCGEEKNILFLPGIEPQPFSLYPVAIPTVAVTAAAAAAAAVGGGGGCMSSFKTNHC
jgi:hypothetical protein